MIPRDLHNTLTYRNAASPDAYNNLGSTPVVTSIIDLKDYVGLEFVITTGDLSDTNATYAVEMTHGDAVDSESAPTSITDSAAVPDAELLPSGTGQEAAIAFTFALDDGIRTIGYAGSKRFVRLTVTPTGADSGDSDMAIVAVLKPRVQGTAN